MQTIRLWRPGSVAHLAIHDSVRGWHSLCTLLWHGSEWIDAGERLVTLRDWQGRGAGRALHLDHVRDLPLNVVLCSYCVRRLRGDADDVEHALAVRGG